jgi:anti-sigma B factor antagonist
MAFDLVVNNDTFVLTLSGNVDLSETSNIKDALANEPKAGFKKLSINAESVDYMDSSAVAVLLFSKRLAEEHQMLFEISSISETAAKVIKLAGLDKVFKLPAEQSLAPEDMVEDSVNLGEVNDTDIPLNETINLTEEVVEESPKEEDTLEINLDFGNDSSTDNEMDLDLSFDDDPKDKAQDKETSPQPVDKTGESGQNLSNGDDSGDSKSDDFEFKPGTFE